MNGNELNNMAQRYKDEMMRLYKKSGASDNAVGTAGSQSFSAPQERQQVQSQQTQAQQSPPSMQNFQAQNSSQSSHSQPCPSSQSGTRDMSGTPVPNMPNASFFGSANQNAQGTVNIPVSCECRFPTAESIISSIAQTPVTLPITPEDNPPPVDQGSFTQVQPRSSQQQDTRQARQSADNSRRVQVDTGLSGIMLNSSPDVATYTVPSESENPQEIMPDFPLPADIPADSSEAAPLTASFLPSMGWVSMTGDNSWGFLQFDVFTAGGAYPVQGALITVTKQLPSGSGLVRILFSNRSGRTATIALPAPSRSFSQSPGSTTRPFSEYSVTVRAKGYYTIRDIKIPIFAGVKTVQPIDLIPLPEYGGIQPRNSSDNSITDSPSVG